MLVVAQTKRREGAGLKSATNSVIESRQAPTARIALRGFCARCYSTPTSRPRRQSDRKANQERLEQLPCPSQMEGSGVAENF